MRGSPTKGFDQVLHPYVFLLKEGKEIKSDFLDYSLLLLQVGQPDIIPSPRKNNQSSTLFLQLLKK
ncbi:MAG: hypothetical protein H0W88_00230 [Parachlamydiaceae bacterium]|nr:hypothetical protein [Parachlamydiaceae bacterium]